MWYDKILNKYQQENVVEVADNNTANSSGTYYIPRIRECGGQTGKAVTKYHESKAMFAEKGMNLREYTSNSSAVNAAIPEKDRLQCKEIKFLGVNYDIEKDAYNVSVQIFTKERLTKRDIVSQLNSIYDPIGVAGPLLIKLKSLMREIYSTGVDWRETIPQQLAQKWNEACEHINDQTKLNIGVIE
ncbi:hypothetical protein OESDEN_06498 [Oesophagostomum dentatum]|uniref:Uncharacterized protein n=1 Tax=Oesophagostomum dentatum TaxID=61180 RepID=A0A0B1T7R0_OESDE|nr:hypothetical protein OESDEN_06498 [Oesophagostomum dentatum]